MILTEKEVEVHYDWDETEGVEEEENKKEEYNVEEKKEKKIKKEKKKKEVKKQTNKIKKKTKTKTTLILASIVFLIAVVIVIFIVNKSKPETADKSIAAIVNGEIITLEELDAQYGKMTPEEKTLISKEFLLEVLVDNKILLQKAAEKNIIVTGLEADAEINKLKAQFPSEEVFNQFLESQGMTLQTLREIIIDQLKIKKSLDQEAFKGITVTDSEIQKYYEENIDQFTAENGDTIPLEEIKAQIEQALLSSKQRAVFRTYMTQLRAQSDVNMYYANKSQEIPEDIEISIEEETFKLTPDEICKEDDKPIIRLFSTTTCPHCNWIKEGFDSVVKEYEDKGLIKAYHWQLDSGDNTLTTEVENKIPKSEVEIFKKYNPGYTVPTFVFGCKYYRIGNAYDDVEKEKEEFKKVINSLL